MVTILQDYKNVCLSSTFKCTFHIEYVASRHFVQIDIKLVLRMVLSEPLGSLITSNNILKISFIKVSLYKMTINIFLLAHIKLPVILLFRK